MSVVFSLIGYVGAVGSGASFQATERPDVDSIGVPREPAVISFNLTGCCRVFLIMIFLTVYASYRILATSLAVAERGATLYRAGEYDQSRQHLERAVEHPPIDPGVRNTLGWTLYRLGQTNEVTRIWHEILHATPSSIRAHNAIGSVLQKQGKDPGRSTIVRDWFARIEAQRRAGFMDGEPVIQEEQAPPAGHTRELEVHLVDKAPNIDGHLDEPVWENAAVANHFWISEQRRRPSERTRVKVLATTNALYFGFICYDREPELIFSKELTRDSSLGFDDRVVVELDPFHDHRNISSFEVNAIGTQRHIAGGGRAGKLEWKGDWSAAARITEQGWVAELAIPLDILNFDTTRTMMGINLVRYHNRTREWSRWADVTPQFKLEEMGQLTGLELPAASQQRSLTLMPYALVGLNIPDKEGDVKDTLFNVGVDIRWEPRQNITLVLSVNPDFSQIEKQVTDIDFDYNEKKLPEIRTFFVEGSGYFPDDSKYFYSLRVPGFDVGAKAFGQVGSVRSGLLVTRAPGNRVDAVAHLGVDLAETHDASASVVSSRRSDFDNDLVTMQLKGRNRAGFLYEGRVAGTKTSGMVEGDGEQGELVLGWQWDYWTVKGMVDTYDRTFFAANGLVKDDVLGTDGAVGTVNYKRDYGDAAIREVTGLLTWEGRQTESDRIQRRTWYGGGSVELRQPFKVGVFRYQGDYRPVDAEQPDGFSDTTNKDRYWTVQLDGNTRSSVYGWGGGYSWGQLGGETYRFPYAYGWAKPNAASFVSVSSQIFENYGTSRQTVLNAGWDFNAYQSLTARYIRDDKGDWYRIAYQRRALRGTDIYLVFDKMPEHDNQVSLKLVRTF